MFSSGRVHTFQLLRNLVMVIFLVFSVHSLSFSKCVVNFCGNFYVILSFILFWSIQILFVTQWFFLIVWCTPCLLNLHLVSLTSWFFLILKFILSYSIFKKFLFIIHFIFTSSYLSTSTRTVPRTRTCTQSTATHTIFHLEWVDLLILYLSLS